MTCTCSSSKYLVLFKKLTENAQLPTKGHESDACYDMYAAEECIIPPFTTKKVKTGIGIRLPSGFKAHLYTRSGLGSKGIQIGNCPGVIDPGYTGDLTVPLYNSTNVDFKVNIGDRICQIGIEKIYEFEFIEVDDLGETDRGNNGFGSTGK